MEWLTIDELKKYQEMFIPLECSIGETKRILSNFYKGLYGEDCKIAITLTLANGDNCGFVVSTQNIIEINDKQYLKAKFLWNNLHGLYGKQTIHVMLIDDSNEIDISII